MSTALVLFREICREGGCRRPRWQQFEDLARQMIKELHHYFEIDEVADDVTVVTGQSGYRWHIDILGESEGEDGKKISLFECRLKRRNLVPSEVGELAYRLRDIGAKRAFFVTVAETALSVGAQLIADHERIGHVRIDKNATPENYTISWGSHFIRKHGRPYCQGFEHIVEWKGKFHGFHDLEFRVISAFVRVRWRVTLSYVIGHDGSIACVSGCATTQIQIEVCVYFRLVVTKRVGRPKLDSRSLLYFPRAKGADHSGHERSRAPIHGTGACGDSPSQSRQ
jgi:hypothetical protein